jgi:hypothetical protein
MTKTQAFAMTGLAGTQALAAALGVTRSAVWQWPDPLTFRQANEVMGLAVRLGRLRLSAEDAAMVQESIDSQHSKAAA